MEAWWFASQSALIICKKIKKIHNFAIQSLTSFLALNNRNWNKVHVESFTSSSIKIICSFLCTRKLTVRTPCLQFPSRVHTAQFYTNVPVMFYLICRSQPLHVSTALDSLVSIPKMKYRQNTVQQQLPTMRMSTLKVAGDWYLLGEEKLMSFSVNYISSKQCCCNLGKKKIWILNVT